MTSRRRTLITLLSYVQNNLSTPIDILTFTGFMDADAEVAAHLMRYAKDLPPAKQARLAEMARELNA